MITNDNEKNAKKCMGFSCEKCDFITYNKYNFTKHLSTDKHKMITNDNEKMHKNAKAYDCFCGKTYKYASGLSIHKKKCQQNNSQIIHKEELKNNTNEEIVTLKGMLFEMVNQNKELQKTIQDLIPKIGNNNNTTNNTNNIIINNLTLLNDNCKDALTLNEFIDSIQIEMKHLLHTSNKGLTNGITNLFLENYNKLPLQKRPLWCGDKKRKKIYIKEEEWQEDKNNTKTKEAIISLTNKQAKNTNKYTKENPDWMEHDQKKESYINIVKVTMSELDENKQTTIINTLLDNVHLNDEVKNDLQKLL